MSAKVIIRGHVFDYSDKAPFVASGRSVLGAIEYDEEKDKRRCHECGEWFGNVGHHLRHHGIKAYAYRQAHGLARATSLASRASSARCGNAVSLANLSRSGKTGYQQNRRVTDGQRNMNNTCRAQLLFRIQTLAAQIGHTPTKEELRAEKIWPQVLAKRFGSVRDAVLLVGLEPNENHGPGKERVKNLPDERMPWPKEYFDAGLIGLERRADVG